MSAARTAHAKLHKASIIVPAYNAEKTIAECLHALQSQTIPPAEIIVVDDGSKDRTGEVVQGFKQVKLVSQKNHGPARARNAGAAMAKSEIIIFLDSDCVPSTDWLGEMLVPFVDEKVVGVQGAYRTKQRSPVAQFDQADIETRYLLMEKAQKQGKLDWIGSYSAAYRKADFSHAGGFDESFPKASGEDAELSYRLAESGKKLVFAPRAIVYHTHPATLGKYLHVKFFRAYWRMRMYLKHPQKMVEDSYTPQSLKLGIVAGIGIGLLSFIYILFGLELVLLLPKGVGYFLIGISGIMISFLLGGIAILLLSPALLQKIKHGTWQLMIVAPFILLLRALAFGLGMLFGLLDPRVRA